MFENNTKFPKFFIYMYFSLIVLMFISMIFGATIVGIVYFCALLLTLVFLGMDRSSAEPLANYKALFILLDIINLVAIIAILIFEWFVHSIVLNILLFVFAGVEVFMITHQGLNMKARTTSKVESVFVGILKIGSMICMLTYFYGVSSLFFAIDAMIFEIANLGIKICFNKIDIKEKSDKITEEDKIESMIQKPEDDGGDLD